MADHLSRAVLPALAAAPKICVARAKNLPTNMSYIPLVRVTGVSVYPSSVASTRLRLDPVLAALGKKGHEVRQISFLEETDMAMWLSRHWSRISILGRRLLRHLRLMKTTGSPDALIIQRESTPTALFDYKGGQSAGITIWDVDDALWNMHKAPVTWLRGRTRKYLKLARRVDQVWAGSPSTSRWAFQAGAKRVDIVPTCVRAPTFPCGQSIMNLAVWIGTPSTSPFINHLLEAIAPLVPNWQFVVMGSGAHGVTANNITHLSWSQEAEVELLTRASVGLYPLDRNHPLTDGKSAFKANLYRAYGIPVVATPTDSVKYVMGDPWIGGIAAETPEDWVSALRNLENAAVRDHMGREGHSYVHAHFEAESWAEYCSESIEDLTRLNGIQPTAASALQDKPENPIPLTIGVFTHNDGPFIEECLASFLGQMGAADRVVIFDDASDDETLARVRETTEALPDTLNIQVMGSSANLGYGARLRQFLRMVDTQHCMFINGDDIVLPKALSTLRRSIYEYPEAAIHFGAYRLVDTAGNFLPETLQQARRQNVAGRYQHVPHSSLFDVLLYGSFIPGALTVFDMRFLRIPEILPTLTNGEDYALVLLASISGSAHFVGEDLFLYRRHPANKSRGSGVVSSNIRALEELKAQPDLEPYIKDVANLARLRSIAGDYRRRRDLAALVDNLFEFKRQLGPAAIGRSAAYIPMLVGKHNAAN